MTIDEQFAMFGVQSAWLEAELEQCMAARPIDWIQFDEIRLRHNQLNREFNTFMEKHQHD